MDGALSVDAVVAVQVGGTVVNCAIMCALVMSLERNASRLGAANPVT